MKFKNWLEEWLARKLKSKAHPNWNYLYHQMLFQEVTRVREKLAIVVIGNPDVFSHLIKIKQIRTSKVG